MSRRRHVQRCRGGFPRDRPCCRPAWGADREGVASSVRLLIQGARQDSPIQPDGTGNAGGGANVRPPPVTAAPAASGRSVSVLLHNTAKCVTTASRRSWAGAVQPHVPVFGP